jgi:hypothetical protein
VSRRRSITSAASRTPFGKIGASIYAYNYSFGNDFTDEEIDRGFEHARALGAEIITASTNLTVAKRVVPFAEKHKMAVAVHNHSNTKDPNEFATPESFAAAMALSKYFKVNLDIGHFTAANYDPVAYLREHHADITNLTSRTASGSGRQHAVGHRRHEDPRGAGAAQAREVADPRLHRIRVSRARRRREEVKKAASRKALA